MLFLSDKNKERDKSDYLWCPFAEITDKRMKTRGKYKMGFPGGAVVHYTAGRDNSEADAKNTLNWSVEQGFCFFLIGPTGVIYQNFPLSHWGYHAGASFYKDIKSGVSSRLVGIEVVCSGKVYENKENKYGSWFHLNDSKNPKMGFKSNAKLYSDTEVRYVDGDLSTCLQQGFYKKYTTEQEESLVQLLLWLKSTKPDIFNLDYVVGHMEVSPYRKADPGGSISMNMNDFRQKLKNMNNGFNE